MLSDVKKMNASNIDNQELPLIIYMYTLHRYFIFLSLVFIIEHSFLY